MRNQGRTYPANLFSFTDHHPTCQFNTKKISTRIGEELQEHYKKQQEMLKNIGTIILIGFLSVGGSYFFLAQLAQYGW